MRRGAVPVRVSLSSAYKYPVAHIHRYDELLSGLCGDGSFAQDHALHVYVVVYRFDGLAEFPAHPVRYLAYHCGPVENGVPLYRLHIGDIVVVFRPLRFVQPAEVFRNVRRLRLQFLDLFAYHFRRIFVLFLYRGDHIVVASVVFVLPLGDRELLIVRRRPSAEAAASAVDRQPYPSL